MNRCRINKLPVYRKTVVKKIKTDVYSLRKINKLGVNINSEINLLESDSNDSNIRCTVNESDIYISKNLAEKICIYYDVLY